MAKKNSSFRLQKNVIALIAAIVVVIGLGAAYVLSQSSQNIAPKASETGSRNPRCNLRCKTDADCQDTAMTCVKTSLFVGCRLRSNPGDRLCGGSTPSPSPDLVSGPCEPCGNNGTAPEFDKTCASGLTCTDKPGVGTKPGAYTKTCVPSGKTYQETCGSGWKLGR